MKIFNCDQKTEEWLSMRRGKITGTRLTKIISKTSREDCLYEVMAEMLIIDDGINETELERGNRLESEALDFFEGKTGNKITTAGLCVSDENENIANSPDGLIQEGDIFPASVEIKCLSSKNHIEIALTNEIPKKYFAQNIQYFVVDDNRKIHYFVSYDPRVVDYPMHIITMRREEYEDIIKEYKQKEKEFLNEVKLKISELLSKTF
jgi:putative phage-type endonuclease